MSNQSYNIVYQVPGMSQPTAMSCWATSFAMLINYLQGTQYTPDDIAQAIGKTTNEYDDNADDHAVAQAFGLNVTACACYNIDGWAQLLGSYGPLYIGINGNTHAVLITGLTSDGTEEGTTFYINDPWDGAVSKNYATLTQIYENIDNETEFWIAHQ
ncbi:MAG TPA: papain-like cysteine protease family protein [Acidimicrobiia bacterium]|nr:papain-like cysteine protease family protein [Acidimicrobiia bacterium]